MNQMIEEGNRPPQEVKDRLMALTRQKLVSILLLTVGY
jgi:hypothetical protein